MFTCKVELDLLSVLVNICAKFKVQWRLWMGQIYRQPPKHNDSCYKNEYHKQCVCLGSDERQECNIENTKVEQF